MKKMFLLTTFGLACVMAMGSAYAASDQQSKMGTCNADAKTKELKGEDRKKFMSECLSAKPAASASEPGSGTSQQNKMKTCNADAKTKELKGEERKTFMSECLKAK